MEHDEQVALFHWIRMYQDRIPELKYVFAIPNGGMRPKKRNARGKLYSPEAERLRAEGVRPGVLDVQMPIPYKGYHGLWIEMKYGKNDLTEEQSDFAKAMIHYGHCVRVCWDWESARDVILDYMGLLDFPDILPPAYLPKIKRIPYHQTGE